MKSAGVGLGLYAVVSAPEKPGAVPDDVGDKAHHLKGGNGFTNPWASYSDMPPWKIFWVMARRKLTGTSHSPDLTPSSITIPLSTPSFHPTRSTPFLRATWLGHACFYLEFPSGLRVLFDPVFEDCCAPVSIPSLKRYTPPACEIEDLPFVDVVVISHSHYDHLSYPSIVRIKDKFPGARFFVPLGNKGWFEGCGVGNVSELDWWEEKGVKFFDGEDGEGKGKEVFKATIGALPCQHVSARTPFDKNKTLWASWSVESGGAKVWFAGDTGYRTVPSLPPGADDYSPSLNLPHCPAFSQIGALRGPFDLGLIPIGAYEPRFLFSNVHASPKDAVNIFLDTKCKTAIGMHWGTWVLTEEEVMEPPRALEEACKWKGVEEGRFGVVGIGEGKEIQTGVDVKEDLERER